MFKKSDLEVLGDLLELANGAEVYLYGETFRNMCLNAPYELLDVLIHDTDARTVHVQEQITEFGEKNGLRIIISTELPWERQKAIYTLNTLRISVNNLILNSDGNVEAEEEGIKHLIDKELCLTTYGTEAIKERPELILDCIVVASQYSLSFEIESMKAMFNCRHDFKDINRKHVHKFLTELFYKSHKIRKGIALVNTLGVSLELFGKNLNESSILNHLNKKDLFEYFTIIFESIETDDLSEFLIEKAGFNSWDIKDVVNETKILAEIKNTNLLISAEQNMIMARAVIRQCGTKRLPSLVRLIKLSGYKELSKLLKEQKDAVTCVDDLAITLDDVKASFRVTDEEAQRILDLALDKVILRPELNDQFKLLSLLNKDLESVKHG